jgi:hypothetical protein
MKYSIEKRNFAVNMRTMRNAGCIQKRVLPLDLWVNKSGYGN